MTLSIRDQRKLNLSDSGLKKHLDYSKAVTIVDEYIIIEFMEFLGIKYYGAIDPEDRKPIFEEFGLIITPARNQGENKWYIENYL